MKTTMCKAVAAAAWLALGSVALAQQAPLVTIEVTHVTDEIAKNISVDASQIPLTVQGPVEVAAEVCGVAADVLSQQAAGGSANCQAKSSSSALDQIVHQQMKGSAQQ